MPDLHERRHVGLCVRDDALGRARTLHPTHGPELSSKTVLLGYQGTLTRAIRTGTEWVTAATPDLTVTTEAIDAGVRASLIWTSAPVATFEADWTIRLTDADGNDVDDLVPFLGADAHCILVNAETTWGSHTHAWFPDMARMTPSMTMPHLYPGPEVPFAYTFPAGGTYKIWVQFQRESTSDYVYKMPFVFDVAG